MATERRRELFSAMDTVNVHSPVCVIVTAPMFCVCPARNG